MAEHQTPGVPEVLFVGVHDAGRSQTAAALLDHHASGRVAVRSAGSAPGDEIPPEQVRPVRDDIDRRVRGLLAELTTTTA